MSLTITAGIITEPDYTPENYYTIERTLKNGKKAKITMYPRAIAGEYTKEVAIPPECIVVPKTSASIDDLPIGLVNKKSMKLSIDLQYLLDYYNKYKDDIDPDVVTYAEDVYKLWYYIINSYITYSSFSLTYNIYLTDFTIFNSWVIESEHLIINWDEDGNTSNYITAYDLDGVYVQKIELEKKINLSQLTNVQTIELSDSVQWCFEVLNSSTNTIKADYLSTSATKLIDIWTKKGSDGYYTNKCDIYGNHEVQYDYEWATIQNFWDNYISWAYTIWELYCMHGNCLTYNNTVKEKNKEHPYYHHNFFKQDNSRSLPTLGDAICWESNAGIYENTGDSPLIITSVYKTIDTTPKNYWEWVQHFLGNFSEIIGGVVDGVLSGGYKNSLFKRKRKSYKSNTSGTYSTFWDFLVDWCEASGNCMLIVYSKYLEDDKVLSSTQITQYENINTRFWHFKTNITPNEHTNFQTDIEKMMKSNITLDYFVLKSCKSRQDGMSNDCSELIINSEYTTNRSDVEEEWNISLIPFWTSPTATCWWLSGDNKKTYHSGSLVYINKLWYKENDTNFIKVADDVVLNQDIQYEGYDGYSNLSNDIYIFNCKNILIPPSIGDTYTVNSNTYEILELDLVFQSKDSSYNGQLITYRTTGVLLPTATYTSLYKQGGILTSTGSGSPIPFDTWLSGDQIHISDESGSDRVVEMEKIKLLQEYSGGYANILNNFIMYKFSRDKQYLLECEMYVDDTYSKYDLTNTDFHLDADDPWKDRIFQLMPNDVGLLLDLGTMPTKITSNYGNLNTNLQLISSEYDYETCMLKLTFFGLGIDLTI